MESAPSPGGPFQPGVDSRPWFGPKHVGFGLRPQTWQGWVVIILVVAAVIVVRLVVARHLFK